MATIRIKINGREYDSLEAVPPALRRTYEEALAKLGSVLADRDGSGVPDLIEGKGPKKLTDGVVIDRQIIVNSRKYGSTEELPEEVRRLYHEAMSRVQQGQDASFTKQGLQISLDQSHSGPGTPIARDLPAMPPSVEPAGVVVRVYTTIILAAGVAIAVLLLWALWR